jgi:hypothetical protein
MLENFLYSDPDKAQTQYFTRFPVLTATKRATLYKLGFLTGSRDSASSTSLAVSNVFSELKIDSTRTMYNLLIKTSNEMINDTLNVKM